MIVTHTFPPVYDSESRVLLLGTMPSPKSREQGFYYGHPRNRFWMVLADIFKEPPLAFAEEKIMFCHRHHLAVWDVLASCEIEGADDNSIKNPVPNDMGFILESAPIKAVFTTGTKADLLYRKYCYETVKLPAVKLPSTSPANCGMSYEKLREAYSAILSF